MGFSSCTTPGTSYRLRCAIITIVLLLAGSLWLPSVTSPWPSASILTPSSVSRPAGHLTNPRSSSSRGPPGPQESVPLSDPDWEPPPAHHRPQLVLQWTNPFTTSFHIDNTSFFGCPVDSCVGTTNRRLLSKADVVVFSGLQLDLSNLPKRRRPQQLFVFHNRESPQETSKRFSVKKLDNFFNMTMTYSREADLVFPYGKTAKGREKRALPSFNRRRRPVAWMVSHCKTFSRREKYVTQLRHHLPVDTFGRCGDQRCNGSRTDCYRQLAESHLFYLAFENSLCDEYITEKFWLALQVGMVPVVRGPSPDAYRRVAPPHSFIHVEEFNGPKELAKYLLYLAQHQMEYDKYHTWRQTSHVAWPRPSCDLCHWLGQGGRRRHRTVRLSREWSVHEYCHEPRDLNTGPVR